MVINLLVQWLIQLLTRSVVSEITYTDWFRRKHNENSSYVISLLTHTTFNGGRHTFNFLLVYGILFLFLRYSRLGYCTAIRIRVGAHNSFDLFPYTTLPFKSMHSGLSTNICHVFSNDFLTYTYWLKFLLNPCFYSQDI